MKIVVEALILMQIRKTYTPVLHTFKLRIISELRGMKARKR